MTFHIKKICFHLIVLVVLTCLIEASSWIFFVIKKDRFSFSNPGRFTLDDRDVKKVAQRFDFKLGWQNKFDTEFGQRPVPFSYSEDLMTVFGDSFTYGSEVEDHETWPFYLSSLFKKNVYNFGTGAYGVDQAYLRFLEDHKKVKTRYTALCLITENLNRCVNVYRKFYMPGTGIPATKPRFVLEGDDLVLIDNPIRTVDDLVKLKDEKFIREIGRDDYWYNRANRPHFSFPYSRLFFYRSIWFEMKHGRLGDKIDQSHPLMRVHPWKDEKNRELLFRLFDKFVCEAKKSNSTPVIFLVPISSQIVFKLKRKETPQAIQMIIDYGQSKGLNIYCPIDELMAEILSHRNSDLYIKMGHFSANGNKTLAFYFHQYLLQLQKSQAEG